MGSETSKSANDVNGGRKLNRNSQHSMENDGNTNLEKRITRSSGNIAPPQKMSASNSCNENLLSVGVAQNNETKTRSNSTASLNTKAKRTVLPLKNRQLIQSCFQTPHEHLGKRILKRAAEKRKDFARIYFTLTSEQKDDIEETIKMLLKKSVANIEFIDEVQRLAQEFGGRFVQYRAIGFKADYFATIADATITECIFLDNAVHQAHQTLSAFSQFITMLLSSVRDGFYAEMKRLRRTSATYSTGSNGSNKKATVNSSRDVSPRSDSPESMHQSNESASAEDIATPSQHSTSEGENNVESTAETPEPKFTSITISEKLTTNSDTIQVSNIRLPTLVLPSVENTRNVDEEIIRKNEEATC